ncbi:hypothetical protein SAICODRAFT_28112 [Saitoella complicata NRRL Y-17804]|uniref:uncharacterized protein n=1 Tax=Saitoella complicata (strain BCRC 22490 / CBS 7301 / JCM 7358 / NBRC 10748 / NRRL Y-17804) TaxID=698492 RepID=UPI0008681FD7|nr:uncharacterized protein SAICODRAFT_28112 [Saitoella complicata NRRL Y-17804]ODQ49771.1 hypothetical protein SAICODRAFT_28112 [Saitoella complicata NRRL Y-17804]
MAAYVDHPSSTWSARSGGGGLGYSDKSVSNPAQMAYDKSRAAAQAAAAQQAAANAKAESQDGETGSAAFHSQLEEVEKAVDNLLKTGKLYAQPGRQTNLPSLPGASYGYDQRDPRIAHTVPSRHYAAGLPMNSLPHISQIPQGLHHAHDMDMHQRSHSGMGIGNMRQREAEQLLHLKRRVARQEQAHQQRVREEMALRERDMLMAEQQHAQVRGHSPAGYAGHHHQGGYTDEERKSLLARRQPQQQVRSMGLDGPAYQEDDLRGVSRSNPISAMSTRGPSPRPGLEYLTGSEPLAGREEIPTSAPAPVGSPTQMRAPSTKSNSSLSPPASAQFSAFFDPSNNTAAASTTQASSPDTGAPLAQRNGSIGGKHAPIGTRPIQSPLQYPGFEDAPGAGEQKRSVSAGQGGANGEWTKQIFLGGKGLTGVLDVWG